MELIEAEKAEYDDFDQTKDAYNIRCGDRVHDENVLRCVKLRGLPYTVTKMDVVEFFTGLQLDVSDVTLDVTNGKNTGYAVVELRTEQDKKRALDLNKKQIGSRWIGVTQAEVMRKNKQADAGGN